MNNLLEADPGSDGETPLSTDARIEEIKSFDWLSAGQFALSLFSAVFLLGAFLVTHLLLAAGSLIEISPERLPQDIPSRNFTAGLGFAGLLMIPSLVHSARRLFGQREARQIEWKNFTWVSLLLPVPFLVGYWIQVGPAWAHQYLPVVHVIANGAGLLWVLYLAWGRMPGESAQRIWGSLVSGISLVPPIAFALEIILLFVIGMGWFFIIQSNPEYANDLQTLYQFVQQSPSGFEIPQAWAEQFLTRPGVVGTILFYIAGLVPIVEELLKPMVLWFVLHRKPTPREGFLIGATAGAGYAMFENLTIGANLEDWAFITVSRLGTAAIHVLASGLVGWGLASAAADKKAARLLGAFLAAFSLHAVWNGLNIITALGEIPAFQDRALPFLADFADFTPAGLLLLALGSIFGLIRANNYFRRAIIAQDSN